MAATHVYLVPGFFGFTSLGALNYFYRVEETLERALADRGVVARIVGCPTQPTGSIRNRALVVLDHVFDTGGDSATDVHFVGHSAGGLDVRLLTTPGVRLRPDDLESRIAERTRSVVTIATPHFGTPIASFFNSLAGKQVLQLLTLLATTTGGRYGILAGATLLRAVARFDDLVGRDNTFLDSMVNSFLRRISSDENDPVWQFLREVARDQGAIIQLTPESMHLFNAAVTDRPGVAYSSVLTAAPNPPRNYQHAGFQPSQLALSTTFAFLHTLASRAPVAYPYPHGGLGAIDEFLAELPFVVGNRTNDGVVPTLSQIHGEVLEVTVADHLDVVGQFPGAGDGEHSDWLPSGSKYDESRFKATWGRVADAIVGSRSA